MIRKNFKLVERERIGDAVSVLVPFDHRELFLREQRTVIQQHRIRRPILHDGIRLSRPECFRFGIVSIRLIIDFPDVVQRDILRLFEIPVQRFEIVFRKERINFARLHTEHVRFRTAGKIRQQVGIERTRGNFQLNVNVGIFFIKIRFERFFQFFIRRGIVEGIKTHRRLPVPPASERSVVRSATVFSAGDCAEQHARRHRYGQ